MAINEETVSILPFSSLSDRDFNHFPGNWSVPNLDEMNDLYNLLPNPDKTDQSDPDCSKYYSIKKLNYVLKKSALAYLFSTVIPEAYLRILIPIKKFGFYGFAA